MPRADRPAGLLGSFLHAMHDEDVAAAFGALILRPLGKPVGLRRVLGEAERAAVRQAARDHRPCGMYLKGWGCPSSALTRSLPT